MKLQGASVQDLLGELLSRFYQTGHGELAGGDTTLAEIAETYEISVEDLAAALHPEED